LKGKDGALFEKIKMRSAKLEETRFKKIDI